MDQAFRRQVRVAGAQRETDSVPPRGPCSPGSLQPRVPPQFSRVGLRRPSLFISILITRGSGPQKESM